MRKVTSEGGEGVSERTRDGATERGRGSKEERGGMEIGRDGNFKGGNLRRTLDNLQYTAVSAQNNTQRGPCHCDFGSTCI